MSTLAEEISLRFAPEVKAQGHDTQEQHTPVRDALRFLSGFWPPDSRRAPTAQQRDAPRSWTEFAVTVVKRLPVAGDEVELLA